jgi:4-hydroxybenzoate polyprenyltransferase
VVRFLVAIVRELIAIAERFAWALVILLSAGIILGLLFGSPSPWVLLAVAVIGVLLYGEYLRHHRTAR